MKGQYKMKYIKFIALAVCFFMLTACNADENIDTEENPITTVSENVLTTNILPEKCPEDFSFSFIYGYNIKENYNGIDSDLGTVSKDLILNGTSSAPYQISDEDMQNIYSEIINQNIVGLCNLGIDITSHNLAIFTGNDGAYGQMPCEEYIFKFSLNGVLYTLKGDETTFNHPNDSEIKDEFSSFIKYLKRFVEGTSEFQSMPKAEGGYD